MNLLFNPFVSGALFVLSSLGAKAAELCGCVLGGDDGGHKKG